MSEKSPSQQFAVTSRKATATEEEEETNRATVKDEEEKLLSTRKTQGPVIVWKSITAVVPTQDQNGKKTVLRDVSGVAYPNEVLAIMGSSGAGKTTLMNILAYQEMKGVEKTGSVLVNRQELGKMEVRSMSAYVQQVDLFVGTLTVKEQLTYSALLRMGKNFTKKQKREKIEDTIRQFNLTDCQNTIIGVPNNVKGISVGEKKRLAFACEVLTDPAIFFCDEPTSGLDAFMASQVVQTMQMLAKEGKTVISVIHQPSSSTFNMFNKVLFMANGHSTYHGPVSELCRFFESVGRPVPESYNPADHAISQLAVSPDTKERDITRIEFITKTFEESAMGREMAEYVNRADSFRRKPLSAEEQKARKKKKFSYAVGFFTQLWVLLQRAFLTTVRDPVLLKVRALQVITTALIIGIVNWQLPMEPGAIQNIEGMLYNTCRDMNFLFLFPSINVITSELPVLMREHKAHIYSTGAYFLSKSLAELPQYTVMPLFYACIAYWMTGLIANASTFFIYTLLCTLMVWNAISVAYFFAFAFGDEGNAVTYTPLFVLPMLILGGFYISFDTIPVYLKWASHLSWFRYSFESLQINEWSMVDSIPGCENTTLTTNLTMNRHCPGFNGGQSVLDRRGMHGSVGINLLVMTVFMLGYRLLAFGALVLRSRFAK